MVNDYSFDNLIGENEKMLDIFESIRKVINLKIDISLHGEQGTGKEIIAKVIHYNSNRREKPFISIDLRKIEADKRDEELLGSEQNNTKGLLERANGGTIYIEGIENVNERFQFYIYKIFQNKEIIKVGGDTIIPLDIRVITSYNNNLQKLISQKKINELQYFRTMGVPINIPSLRERGSDIITLANYFINSFVERNSLKKVTLSDGAKEKLMIHSYLGNVSELKAIIEFATVMCNENIIADTDIKLNKAKSNSDFLSNEKTLKDYTRGIIKHFLDKYDNNILLVAEKLDVGKSTIYRMIKNNEV